MSDSAVGWAGHDTIDALQALIGTVLLADASEMEAKCSTLTTSFERAEAGLSHAESLVMDSVCIRSLVWLLEIGRSRRMDELPTAEEMMRLERRRLPGMVAVLAQSVASHAQLDMRDTRLLAYSLIPSSEEDAVRTVAEIARHHGVSASTLHRLLRRYGVGGIQRRRRLDRLAMARRKLETSSVQIKVIAADAGYRSGATFCREFKRTYGIAPKVLRHSLRSSLEPEGSGFFGPLRR